MALHTSLYNMIFKRTSTFAVVILGGGIFFERAYDQATVAIFENINKGKLWKHIAHKYEE